MILSTISQISIFVKFIAPARLLPHLKCLRYYIYIIHVFYLLSFVETALWKSQGESSANLAWRCAIKDPGYLGDGYHWGVASSISRAIAPCIFPSLMIRVIPSHSILVISNSHFFGFRNKSFSLSRWSTRFVLFANFSLSFAKMKMSSM
jgi:hypothetical protein